jgi:hypothetical protein
MSAPIAGAGQDDLATGVSDRASSFRSDFNRILDHYAAVFATRANEKGARAVAQARAGLAAIGDDKLERILAKMPAADLSLAVQAAQRLEASTPPRGQRAGAPQNSSGFPSAPDILSDCDNIEHDSQWTLDSLIAFEVLRTVLAAAEFACLEVVVVLGEGGNGSAVCIPFAIAQDAAAIPFELADFCGGEEDSAIGQGSYDRLEHIHTDLATAQTTILSRIDSAKTEIVNNDNSNRVLIINNDNANKTAIIDNDYHNLAVILADAKANRDFLLGEIRGLSCDLLRLVNTPEGQRASNNASCIGYPQFPYAFPERP